MLSRTGFWLLALAAASLLASASFAAGDVSVGGKGVRVRTFDGRGMRFAEGRPVFVEVDRFADFGHMNTATAPPLRIEVKGDVEIVPLPDGGLRIRFVDDEE